MSLTIASPSTRHRVAQRARPGRSDHSGGHPAGRPQLRVVREGERAVPARGHAPQRPQKPRQAQKPQRGQRSQHRPLRLTRRGHLVVRAGGLLLATVAVIAGVLLINRPAEAGSQVHPVSHSYRTVLPGETLWGIAGEIAPGADRGDTIADIMKLNALTDPAVAAGQRIALPGN